MNRTGQFHIGIDIGGTFTDFSLSDHKDKLLYVHKQPGSAGDPLQTVCEGLNILLAKAGAQLPAVSRITHATTLVANAVLERRILPDSGGAGQYRGGPGQQVVLKNNTGHPVMLSLFGLRTEFPAKGYAGGKDGGLRAFMIDNEAVAGKGMHTLPAGGVFTIQEAGGGGFNDPGKRSYEKIYEDYRKGFITSAGAKKDYGVDIPQGYHHSDKYSGSE